MLRIAVVDAGDLWQKYGEALRRVADVEIGMVIDRDEDAARQLLVSMGGDTFVRRVDELDTHRRDAFDAAIIHSPLDSRADTACELAAIGKHLLVDAPLATTGDDLNRLVLACESADVRLMIRQPLRYSPAVRALRTAVDSGNLGAPGLVRLHHWSPPSLRENGTPEFSRWIWQLCNGEVDLACWLFDTPPETVFALRIGDEIGEDTDGGSSGVQLHLGFAGGGMAMLDCLQTPRSTRQPYFMLTLIGSTGAAYVDDHRNTNLLIQDRTTALQIDSTTDVTLQLQEFHRFISASDSQNSVEDCQCVTAVMEAALASIESGSATPIG